MLELEAGVEDYHSPRTHFIIDENIKRVVRYQNDKILLDKTKPS